MSSQGQRWMQQQKTSLTKKKWPIHASTNNKPSSLENNEEDLIIHEKKKGISNFHPNFMHKFYQSLISIGTMTEQDVS